MPLIGTTIPAGAMAIYHAVLFTTYFCVAWSQMTSIPGARWNICCDACTVFVVGDDGHALNQGVHWQVFYASFFKQHHSTSWYRNGFWRQHAYDSIKLPIVGESFTTSNVNSPEWHSVRMMFGISDQKGAVSGVQYQCSMQTSATTIKFLFQSIPMSAKGLTSTLWCLLQEFSFWVPWMLEHRYVHRHQRKQSYVL